ncbi:MAG: heavy-metal-associated domain-containing protein [Thermomicrobiales bacterium]
MNAGLQEATLTAPDISCDHCVATVQKTVSALDGVERVSADADTQQVVVGFDATRVSLSAIEAAMTEAGYPVAK